MIEKGIFEMNDGRRNRRMYVDSVDNICAILRKRLKFPHVADEVRERLTTEYPNDVLFGYIHDEERNGFSFVCERNLEKMFAGSITCGSQTYTITLRRVG